MKILLEVKDEKVAFVMELLSSLKFVKAKTLDNDEEHTLNEKEELIADIKQAVEELKLVRAGKLKGIPAKQLLDEL